MDVTLPDGSTVNGVPDGTSKAQLAEKLRANGRNVPQEWLAPPAAPKPKEGLLDKARYGVEAVTEPLISAASAIPAQVAGGVAGAAETLTSGKFGTPEGTAAGAKRAGEVAESLTYQPRNPSARNAMEYVSKLIDKSKLQGLNPASAVEMPRNMPISSMRAMKASVGAAAEQTVVDDVAGMPKPAQGPAMRGVGAAETDAARMRRERAGSLPVPMKLSKGQASRDFEQQRFERETAKDSKLGKPLREHFAENNEAILSNFDAWLDQTGAKAPDLYATGRVVDQALVNKARRVKGEINAAYDKARKAGETHALVPTDDLVSFLETNRPAAINATVLKGIEDKLVQLKGASKGPEGLKAAQISLNDMEELRKFIGEAMDGTPTNTLRGKQAKEVIDAITDGRGGQLYREARAKRVQYTKEFEDKGVVAKLLRTKPGTDDRAVALEDVFKHSVLSSSQDDLSVLQKTLTSAGEEGTQAWKDLQGQTVQYLKDVSTKNATTDVRGNRIVSPAALDKAVLDLDRSGKLDVLFGKQGAQMVRDLNDLAKDVHTAPPGTVNSSNTSSVVLEALSHVPVLGKFPLAVQAVAAVKRKVGERRTKAQVRDALEEPVNE